MSTANPWLLRGEGATCRCLHTRRMNGGKSTSLLRGTNANTWRVGRCRRTQIHLSSFASHPRENKHARLQARAPTVAFSILLVARLPAVARPGLAPATRGRRKGISRRGLRRVRRKDQVSYSRSHYHAAFNLADNISIVPVGNSLGKSP